MSFTERDVALLSSSKSRTGKTRASARVNLSRVSCVSSFLTCASTRFMPLLFRRLSFLAHLFDDRDKNILQRIRLFVRLHDPDAFALQLCLQFRNRCLRRFVDNHV